MKYLKTNYADIEEIKIDDIPTLLITPRGDNVDKTIVFYHGWGSSKLNQVFRANIFASYGYRVLLPDAQLHGERKTKEIDYEDEDVMRKYILEVIMHNIEEAPSIFKYVEENFGGEIAVAGHSMGAITAGGLYNFKKDLKMAFIYNGMNDWAFLVEAVNKSKDVENTSYTELRVNDFFLDMDPMNEPENFKDRPIVLFNGKEDNVVNPKAQRNFAEEIEKVYTKKELLDFQVFEMTSHQLTTQMLEASIKFSKEIAGF
ncbi:alpha/beta fold hydrolase [Peptoniphilus sp.]|jgi:predicted esterase|uniref:alpha/beta fold hydrolase n=1 Tax=Peptoniphilus sp. TaxID=1971214 RepID=UPI003D91313E